MDKNCDNCLNEANCARLAGARKTDIHNDDTQYRILVSMYGCHAWRKKDE